MRPLTIEQSPTEDLIHEFDFGTGDFGDLFADDPIDEAACTVKDWSDATLSSASGFIVVGAPAVSPTEPTVLQVRVHGGTHGTDYEVKIKAVSESTDQDAECFVLFKIRRATVS